MGGSPDFPFDYAGYVTNPAGLGTIPRAHYGKKVAIIGAGLAGIVTAYELMRIGLHPELYESKEMGGRLCTRYFPDGPPNMFAELGAMRFPRSGKSLFHYIDKVGLETTPFPNPLLPTTPSTMINMEGRSFYARTIRDLPGEFQDLARKWRRTLDEGASLGEMQRALGSGDTRTVKRIWNKLVPQLDDKSFYSFLCDSPHFSSFRDREIFGQVGFGCGGWDTDFPKSILEILRVILAGAEEDHRTIIGGSSQLTRRLWEDTSGSMAHWPAGTGLASLHPGNAPFPGVSRLVRRDSRGFGVVDASGVERVYDTVVFTPQPGTLLSQIESDWSLLPARQWKAIERMHYMPSSKLFVAVDRPFWLDTDLSTGRDMMSMTLTDRIVRGVYLFGSDPGRPATICLSYTWGDDSLKWMPLSPENRLKVAVRSLEQIYPHVDLRKHIRGSPLAISWEAEAGFMGAFRANLPGQYRYQRDLFTQFMQNPREPGQGFILAGADLSWLYGFAEGAVHSALNAFWAVQRRFNGTSAVGNPGPGDCFENLAPVDL